MSVTWHVTAPDGLSRLGLQDIDGPIPCAGLLRDIQRKALIMTPVIFLLLLNDGHTSLDLRGVKVGDSCESAVRTETKLGSRPLNGMDPPLAGRPLGFAGVSESAAQSTMIIYSCSESNLVDTYSIAVKTHDEDSISVALQSAVAAVTARIGPPRFDSDSLPWLEKVHWKILARQLGLVRTVDWDGKSMEDVSILISVRNSEWMVTTLVQKPRKQT